MNIDKKLKEESKIDLRMNQLEGRACKVEEKLQILVHESVKTNGILLKLLEAQTLNPNDNKMGKKDESLSKPQDQYKEEAIGPSNPNTQSEAVKAAKRKRMSTHTQRHEERKRKKQAAKENRRERVAARLLEEEDQEKKLADLRAHMKEITNAAHVGNLKEVIQKSKNSVSTRVIEEEIRGRDEATLRLIEEIRREVEDEEKLKTNVK